MKLEDAKSAIENAEDRLTDSGYVVAASFERDGRRLEVGITENLRRSCRKGKVWKTRAFLSTFKNAEYGFVEKLARSRGGSDGIFVITRDHRPPNPMMHKLFDHYLDRPGSGVEAVARQVGSSPADLIPVRLVSHHMRLLGLLHRGDPVDTLVLVDYDDTK